MKLFIKFVCRLLLYTIGLAIFLELLLLIRYEIPSDLRQDWHLLGDNPSELLFVGNSRMITHVDTRVLYEKTGLRSKIIGSAGWGSPLINLKLETYLRNTASPPELIIYQADPLMFSQRKDWYAKTIHLKYLLFDQFGIYDRNKDLQGSDILDIYVPIYRYRDDPLRLTRDLLGIRDSRQNFNGFEPTDVAWSGNFKYSGGSWRTDTVVMNETMQQLAQLEHKYGCRVILCEPPFSAPTTSATRSTRILLQESSPFTFWTWNRISEAWNDSTLFRNHSHLRAKGIDRFSNQLADSIQIYLSAQPTRLRKTFPPSPN